MHENKHPSFVNEVILCADRFGELAFLLFIRYSKAQFPPKESFRGDLNEAISLAELRVYMENFPQEESDYNSPLVI